MAFRPSILGSIRPMTCRIVLIRRKPRSRHRPFRHPTRRAAEVEELRCRGRVLGNRRDLDRNPGPNRNLRGRIGSGLAPRRSRRVYWRYCVSYGFNKDNTGDCHLLRPIAGGRIWCPAGNRAVSADGSGSTRTVADRWFWSPVLKKYSDGGDQSQCFSNSSFRFELFC
jgi:hypothetical protein